MRGKRTTTSGKLLSQLTVSQLKQLRSDVSQQSIDLDVQKEVDRRKHYKAFLLYKRFNEEFEKITATYIEGCVDDHLGNSVVTIPAEKIDEWKSKVQSMCEETIAEIIGLLEPFDTRQFIFMVKERALKKATETLNKKVITIESLPQVAFDAAAKTGNAAVLEEFTLLYRRGISEAVQEMNKEIDGLIHFLEVSNKLLTEEKP